MAATPRRSGSCLFFRRDWEPAQIRVRVSARVRPDRGTADEGHLGPYGLQGVSTSSGTRRFVAEASVVAGHRIFGIEVARGRAAAATRCRAAKESRECLDRQESERSSGIPIQSPAMKWSRPTSAVNDEVLPNKPTVDYRGARHIQLYTRNESLSTRLTGPRPVGLLSGADRRCAWSSARTAAGCSA